MRERVESSVRFGVVCLGRHSSWCEPRRHGKGTCRPVAFFGERRRARASSPDNIPDANNAPLEPERFKKFAHEMLALGQACQDAFDVPYSTTRRPSHQSITAMFSTLIRGVTPLLRQQARPFPAAAAHTQAAAAAAAAPSKLDEGEQVIYDKLSERFQPSELLVQDVSGAPA